MDSYAATLSKAPPKEVRNGSITTKSLPEPQCQVAAEIADITTPYGSFGKLPKELRDSIYAMVLASGWTALTVTSQALHEDTQEMLYIHGICRLTVAPWHWEVIATSKYDCKVEKSKRQLQSSFARIQNLHLDFPCPYIVPVSGGREYVIGKLPKDLISSMAKPKRCHAIFTLGSYQNFGFNNPGEVESLRAFESVTVELNHCSAKIDIHQHCPDRFWGRWKDADIIKMVARLLGPNQDKEPAPKLTIICDGITTMVSSGG